MNIARIGTYEPVWDDGRGRVAGLDEDVVTLAVAAATALMAFWDWMGLARDRGWDYRARPRSVDTCR